MTRQRKPLSDTCHTCAHKSCATDMLSVEELNFITGHRYINDIRKKTNILYSGSPFSHIIYLREGLVKEYLHKPDGREQILQIVMPHSYLGLSSLFGDKINHYSYFALTELKVCYIVADVFTSLIRSNGDFAFEIMKSMGKDNLHNFHRFIDLSNKKTYGRIADMLIYFSRVVFSASKFQLPLSRIEIADMVGTSRESVGRVLSRFSADGLIGIAGRNIIISDIKKLEKISRLG